MVNIELTFVKDEINALIADKTAAFLAVIAVGAPVVPAARCSARIGTLNVPFFLPQILRRERYALAVSGSAIRFDGGGRFVLRFVSVSGRMTSKPEVIRRSRSELGLMGKRWR
jgi:hypothetical protein